MDPSGPFDRLKQRELLVTRTGRGYEDAGGVRGAPLPPLNRTSFRAVVPLRGGCPGLEPGTKAQLKTASALHFLPFILHILLCLCVSDLATLRP